MAESTVYEQREGAMIPLTGGRPCLRKAHFLRPTAAPACVQGPILRTPALTQNFKWPLKEWFNGWRNPIERWESWVQTMHPRHASTWKAAGIYDAIMASTHKIYRNGPLLFGLGERWSPDTNTFFFPWGEATITLEDILILGGLPVLGDSIFLPLEATQLAEKGKRLQETLEYLHTLRRHTNTDWLTLFINSGSELEHEAFLSLWLFSELQLRPHIFSIAIHLSGGRRLALGTAVLASIYRDLGSLRKTMDGYIISEANDVLYLVLWSALRLVQVWAWERLPLLRPEPKLIGPGGARLARWDCLRRADVGNLGNVRDAIDSSMLSFLWRPYTLTLDHWTFPSFYREKEEYAKVENLSVELETFVRCLRISQLVGVDYIEPYHPHRVAMQFGFDQDLPEQISWENSSNQDAWNNYIKPMNGDKMLYLPPRLLEADVTVRYLEWWKKTLSCYLSASQSVVKRKRSPRKNSPRRNFKRLILCTCTKDELDVVEDASASHSPGIINTEHLPEARPVNTGESRPGNEAPIVEINSTTDECLQQMTPDYPEVPPGFAPRNDAVGSQSSIVAGKPSDKTCFEEGSSLHNATVEAKADDAVESNLGGESSSTYWIFNPAVRTNIEATVSRVEQMVGLLSKRKHSMFKKSKCW